MMHRIILALLQLSIMKPSLSRPYHDPNSKISTIINFPVDLEDVQFENGVPYSIPKFVIEENILGDGANSSSEYADDEVFKEEYLKTIREFIYPRPWTCVLIVFHVLVFIVGLVGNALVCLAVYKNRRMRTVTNFFLVNLAVADFIVILVCLPFSVVWDVTSTWFFGTAMCKIVLYFQTVSVFVSVLTLTLISVDRWYAICFPLQFKSTTRRAKKGIVVIWIISFFFVIPDLLVYEAKPNEKIEIETIYFTQCEPSWSRNAETKWTVLKIIFLYVLPVGFMTFFYIHISRVLWRSGTTVEEHDGGGLGHYQFSMVENVSADGQLRSRRKAAKMLLFVVGIFGFCYLPVHLLSILRLTAELKNTDHSRAFALISHWLCYANSAVNPIIYNFMSGKFRKEFRKSVYCSCSSASRSIPEAFELNTSSNRKKRSSGFIGHHSNQSNTTMTTATIRSRLDTSF